MLHRAQPLTPGGTAGLVLGQLVASGKGAMRATKQSWEENQGSSGGEQLKTRR